MNINLQYRLYVKAITGILRANGLYERDLRMT